MATLPLPVSSLADMETWLHVLWQFRSFCVGNNVPKNLLKFAQSKITTILPTTADANNFLVQVQTSLGYSDISLADLTTNYKTFQDLANHWDALVTPVADYLWYYSDGSLHGAFHDFWNSDCKTAFPAGSGVSPWTVIMTGLSLAFASAPECFTPKLQTQINQAVDKGIGTKIPALVQQIAGLG
jgi:hypothetical protein